MAIREAGGKVHGPASATQALKASPPVAEVGPPKIGAPSISSYVTVTSLGPGQEPATVTSWFVEKVLPPAVSGAFVALVAGIVIAQAMERFKGRREHLSKSVDALRDRLTTLQKVAASYWSKAYHYQTSPPQEAEIEFILQEVSSLTNLCAPELWKDESDRGPSLVVELMSIATGDQFGAKTRKRDVQRVRGVALRCADLSTAVANARGSYFAMTKRKKR